MEYYILDDGSVSESSWGDFSAEMFSSSLGEMERITEEANRTNEEMMEVTNEEIIGVNEAVAVEANYVNEAVAVEANYVNEAVAVEANYANEAVAIEANYANEVIITAVTEKITSVNEVVISAVTDEATNVGEEVIEAVTDEATSGNEEEASICRQEIEPPGEKESRVKMRHFLSDEKYFFVEDLIEAVKETRNEDEGNSPDQKRRKKDRPSGCAFYFSAKNKYFVQTYIYSQKEDFISLIKESTPPSYICVFETCKERFIERYKPETYSEKSFVNFCAAIAYLGIHCSARGLDPSAESKATNYICSLLYDVLQRGTLQKSSWQKSESYFQIE
ncbi:hypothetical protein AVEN_138140-1 [Araneus ventricosus]|uniref:Uncharacterized protein n=1 Tax=Araneus ventricosus TaxID=182803 RepID=A0A4Y2F9R2_ARAVE|nr:hypothetical protein AVEN_138140-1 [Araneus ventricosus]